MVAVGLVLAGLIGMLASTGSVGDRGGSVGGEGAGTEASQSSRAAQGAVFGAASRDEQRAPAPAPVAGPLSITSGADVGTTGFQGTEPRIVKTAGLSLTVRDGTLADRFQEASLVASRHGGFVSSSRTSGVRTRSGSLLLRIPATEFDRALSEIRQLGTVTKETRSGQDVTAQFVDLQARLRNWQAQEAVLLRLMSKATTIDASIRVQRELQDVQLTIERIRGQLRLLSDQTDMSTILVSMAEAGAPVLASPGAQSPIAKAWHRSIEGFVGVIAAVIVGVGYLVPLAVIGLAAFLGWVFLRKVTASRRAVERPAT